MNPSTAPGPRRAFPSLGAGVLLALSLPPWGWWPLAWPVRGCSTGGWPGCAPGPALWSGWLAGLGCYAPGCCGPGPSTGTAPCVLIALEALFFAAAAVLTPPWRGRATGLRGRRHPGRGRPHDVALRWPPARRRLLGTGGRPAPAVGPDRRTAVAHGRRLGRWGRRGHLGRRRSRRSRGSRTAVRPGRRSSSAGSALVVLLGALVSRRRSAACAPSRWPLVQGGGQRGVEQGAGASRHGVHRPGAGHAALVARDGRPALVLWPEDVIALSGPLRGSAQDRFMAPLARHLHTTVIAGVTEPAGADARSATRSWSGAPNGRIVGTFEKVHRVPFGEYIPYRSLISHLANLSAVPDRRRTRPRHRPAPHAGRTAGHPGLLRGLLRQPQPHLGPGRRRAPDRPDQHLVVRHRAGADPGGGGGRGPGGRDRARPGAGRADRLQHGGHQRGRRAPALGARPAPGAARPPCHCGGASPPTTTGATFRSSCWRAALAVAGPAWLRARAAADTAHS